MHYHCEIIMPPTDDIESSVEKILAPFDENKEERDSSEFWDWWVIGGRFAGDKALAGLDCEKLEAFYAWLRESKVMVSGMVCGKQALSDAATVAKVDAKWREMFPGAGRHCPLFKHSNNQHKEHLPGDIMRLADLPNGVTCARAIIAGTWRDEGLQAAGMLQYECWNGVEHVRTAWDGTVKTALEHHAERIKHYRAEYREAVSPQDDWLVVTVDYHS